jgi:tyrosinase
MYLSGFSSPLALLTIGLQDTFVIAKTRSPRGLKVTISSIPVHLPESDTEVPVYVGDWEYHPDIIGGSPQAVYNTTSPYVTANKTARAI